MGAVNSVDFEIRRGEAVGIIGWGKMGCWQEHSSKDSEPNYASSLMGRARIDGRIASLLEVGTGFHQELTGCENIFLNGAILGMTRGQRSFVSLMKLSPLRNFEEFLDTPVKRYSSGMYVRLAFAVAAHLEPEILIVDEVLAVGDAAFQRNASVKWGISPTTEELFSLSATIWKQFRACANALFG